jgi:hypothetical protein
LVTPGLRWHPAPVDGRDPTQVITRRCIAIVFVVVQGITGASPGKALLGIRVVRPDGTTTGLLRSFVRALCWAIDGISLLVPVAMWTAWFTPGHRRVGDFAAGTFVVRAGTEGGLSPPGSLPASPPASPPAGGAPTDPEARLTKGG